jgi:hypothetical protein
MKNIKYIFAFFAFYNSYAQVKDSTLSNNQKEILEILKDVRIKNVSHFKLKDFKSSDYKHPLIFKRFTDLLLKKLTEEEIKYLMNGFNEDFRINDSNLVRKIASKSNKPFNYISDSISKAKDTYMRRRIFEESRLNENIILLIGSLDDTDYVPTLKEAIKDKTNSNLDIRLALARLKVEPYYSGILNEFSVKNASKSTSGVSVSYKKIEYVLLYVATQESYSELMKWLDVPGMETDYSDETFKYPIAGYLIDGLYYYFGGKDFKAIFNQPYYGFTSTTLQDIEITRKWVKDNKGKYKINRDLW